jgi:hypothetical protein
LNIYYLPELIKWKLQQGFVKFNAWPHGGGMINWHLAYWPPQLNVKVLPPAVKQQVRAKFEELFVWLADNWQLCTALPADIDRSTVLSADYGIARLRGLLNFMDSEDWSERMPELVEWIGLLDKTRGLNFRATFPEIQGLID